MQVGGSNAQPKRYRALPSFQIPNGHVSAHLGGNQQWLLRMERHSTIQYIVQPQYAVAGGNLPNFQVSKLATGHIVPLHSEITSVWAPQPHVSRQVGARG